MLPSPSGGVSGTASRPDFGPAMRQVLIGLMIILMLRFRPQGLFPERPGRDRGEQPAEPRGPGPLALSASAARDAAPDTEPDGEGSAG